MNLRTALRTQRGDVVTFVGAGGKTTAMFRLAHELAASGQQVITTTTTKIGTPTLEQTRCFVVETDRLRLIEKTAQALEQYRHVTVAREPYADGKYRGIPAEWVGDFRDLGQVSYTLVEADGARKLSLKAPRDGEPVIPPETTVLVACAGMTAVGATLDEQHVCRAERVSSLTGLRPGERVTAETVSTVLSHPQGGLKGSPAGARPVALLNQADDPFRLSAAQQAAEYLKRSGVFDEVLIGAVAGAEPIRSRISRVSAVILAAGEARRFGSPKQLAAWGQTTVLAHCVSAVEQSRADEVLLVLGAHAGEIRASLGEKVGSAQIVVNDDWSAGMSTSLIAGLRHLRTDPHAVIFVLADQPGVSPSLVDRLIDNYGSTGGPIVAPRFRDVRGNPTLWDRSLFSELFAIIGDVGGRDVLLRHPQEITWIELENEAEMSDIDSPEDYERIMATLRPK